MFVLVVEQSPLECRKLEGWLKDMGHEARCLQELSGSAKASESQGFDLILLCMDGQRDRALEFLRRSQDGDSSVPVIIATGAPKLDDAVACMKVGAYDFWVKPYDREKLSKSLDLIRPTSMAQSSSESSGPRPILTRSPAMLKLKEMAAKVAVSTAPVFIQGESGTGKELFARHIHQRSKRADKPFTAVNCAALPENLLESELFGYEKGAFTGAIKSKEGKFELAHGGTLLLDEVTEISTQLQAKLLRVLQEGEVDRLGGKYPVSVDVRIIATSNALIDEALASGQFRRDLYYRLNVIPLKIPPLRERPDDLEPLCAHFIEKYNERNGASVKGIEPDALGRLKAHPWPGNVRELENVIQRAVILTLGPLITVDSLIFDDSDSPGAAKDSGSMELMPLDEMEKRLIYKALGAVNDNRTRAAEILGISVRTLRNKLNEYRAQGSHAA